ncbi:uncharacterized protein B0H18DRAFT_1030335 [Fomitopsis serialis]|uniref:uncharacterized protein n=1 Tax=Fomitopsis serialis TaxID=139415 RepID=UPI002008E37D|nr:uncharacterized protein B0H18DRAFT_1030335 [Neoantrodia serialis]KAH9918671.1 hypothetical protein B0H18DRAFT_1030335 [Neoantrodia serialis]
MTAPKQEPQEAVLPPSKPAHKRPVASEKARKDALKTITAIRRVSAWQIHRWPLEKRIVDERTRVHLPRTYLGKDGIDVRVVRAGQDLNQFVHRYYSEELGKEAGKENEEGKNWVNFVTPDSVLKRRHEYLGPDPRVAGYRCDVAGDMHIKWWDAFLQDQWMNKQKWTFDVRMEEDGRWVEIDD